MQEKPTFPDHFSGHAAAYRAARPGYPEGLFAWLAAQAPATHLAWDVGCGNGQASVALAEHFARVVATDPSAEQLAQAEAHPRVTYVVGTAESPDASLQGVDLVVAATAAHWFDGPRFEAAVRRVARPRAVVACFAYGFPNEPAEISKVIHHFAYETIAEWWPAQRLLVDEGYRNLYFPFAPIDAPTYRMELTWTPEALLAYVRTWSAVQRCLQLSGHDPIPELAEKLTAVWPAGAETVEIRAPLSLRVGRVL